MTRVNVKGIYGRVLEFLKLEKNGFGWKCLRKVSAALKGRYIKKQFHYEEVIVLIFYRRRELSLRLVWN